MARRNILAAPNCKKKQLFGKHKTFLHDVYEKSPFFKNDFILYLKEGGLSLLKIKQNWELPLVAPPFCSPFWLPLWLLQGFPKKSIRKSRINFKIESKTIKDSKDVQVFSEHFIFFRFTYPWRSPANWHFTEENQNHW